jgi:Fe-S cluster biosynthesis and repair protein YggX
MVLLVDDALKLPSTIGKIIFNALAQTVEKVGWTEYSQELKKLLLRARHDYESGKINKEQFKEIEEYVFGEMRIARQVLTSKEES